MSCGLAGDAAWRSDIAARIIERFPRSGLTDSRRYAACLEDAYARALIIKSGVVS